MLFGFRLGLRPIGDNSMFTHLRTGIDIVARGSIPRRDPYSYTAEGTQWVVQSWLPEWTYGILHRLGGFRLVVLEQALLMVLVAWLIVRLARAGSPLRTSLAGLAGVGVGAALWSPRPLLFGLVCMALTVIVVERRRSRWLLIPIVWLWVNSHGSFPLGLVWLGARALGEGLDWRAWPRESLRYVGGFVVGLAFAVLNPLGYRLLSFPLALGSKRDVFEDIVEWGSPDFHGPRGIFALVFVTLSLALLMRARVAWRDLVPSAVFVAASLYSVRNLGVAAIVLAPVLGRAVRRPESAGPPPKPRDTDPTRLRLNRVLAATIAVAFLAFSLSLFTTSGLELRRYPVAAVTYLDRAGLLAPSHRLAHQDFVGNYLTLRYGTRVSVFVDDRYDMYPLAVSRDYKKLLRGEPEATGILDRRAVDVVVWDKALPLAGLLRGDPRWRETFRDADWVVMQRS